MNLRLTSPAIALRVGFLLALSAASLGLRELDPARLPWRASCGAFTGLPCIFCGCTRALHYLLNGDFARALYFNWLAFVVVAAGVGLIAILLCEVSLGHRLLRWPTFRITPQIFTKAALAVFALWLFQVTLAVSFHKHELLNPHGLLYSLVVK